MLFKPENTHNLSEVPLRDLNRLEKPFGINPIPLEQVLFIIVIVYHVTKPGRNGVKRNS